jgi:hypothetical protein
MALPGTARPIGTAIAPSFLTEESDANDVFAAMAKYVTTIIGREPGPRKVAATLMDDSCDPSIFVFVFRRML